MKDYDYITVWLPVDGRTQSGYNDVAINDDCRDWLNTNVGLGAVNFMEWILDYEENKYKWCYSGIDHGPAYDFSGYQRKFHFKDINMATLFKLTWGG